MKFSRCIPTRMQASIALPTRLSEGFEMLDWVDGPVQSIFVLFKHLRFMEEIGAEFSFL